jgi:hypothetical protein
MNILFMLLLWLGAVLFVLAAFGVNSRINLTAAGLFCWIMVSLIQYTDAVL